MNPVHKVDFRFGFYLERCFSSGIDDYVVIAGFEMLNPTLCAQSLMPNLRADHAAVAVKLIAWLRRHGANGGYVLFSISDGQRYIADSEDGQDDLADALLVYASPGRKAESFTWRRAQFSAIAHLPKYCGWSESELINGSGDLAEAALTSFKDSTSCTRCSSPVTSGRPG